MSDVVDYTEVPYLQEILNYLPIDPADEEDVINYIQNITNLIAVNYKYGQYQFAFIEHIGPPLIWFCNFYFNGFLTNMLYFFKNFLILFLCSALGFPNIYYSAKITG